MMRAKPSTTGSDCSMKGKYQYAFETVGESTVLPCRASTSSADATFAARWARSLAACRYFEPPLPTREVCSAGSSFLKGFNLFGQKQNTNLSVPFHAFVSPSPSNTGIPGPQMAFSTSSSNTVSPPPLATRSFSCNGNIKQTRAICTVKGGKRDMSHQ